MRFRKRPVEVDAVKFHSNNEPYAESMDDIVRWIQSYGGSATHNSTDIFIHTLEGTMRASVGDWIIKGVKGEFYPCKPDIFEETYDEVIA